MKLFEADIAIVGAGGAGLRAAIAALANRTWTHPITSTQYTVRLKEPMVFEPQGSNQLWQTVMKIEEL